MKLPSPHIEPISTKDWKLVCKYTITCGRWRIILHSGLTTDGASIPRVGLIWMLMGHPLQGLVLPAALVHDALYQTEMLPRAECDEIFYRLMRDNGVNVVKAWTMYRAVRACGWAVWRTHTRQSIAAALPFVEVEDITPTSPEAVPAVPEPDFVG